MTNPPNSFREQALTIAVFVARGIPSRYADLADLSRADRRCVRFLIDQSRASVGTGTGQGVTPALTK